MSNLKIFNVRGTKIEVDREQISKSTVEGLFRDLLENAAEETGEYYIDENPIFFHAMLDYYQTGLSERPNLIPEPVWDFKCKYWCIQIIKNYSQQEFMNYFTDPFRSEIIDKKTISQDYLSISNFGFQKYTLLVDMENNLLEIPCGIYLNSGVLGSITFPGHHIGFWGESSKNLNDLFSDTKLLRFYTKEDKPLVLEYIKLNIKKRDEKLEAAFFSQFE